MSITINCMEETMRAKLDEACEKWKEHHPDLDIHDSGAYRTLYWYFRWSGLPGEGTRSLVVGE